MTIIDTTLYADGALRLSRHGAGRGGNVLMLTWPDGRTTQQCDVHPGCLVAVEEMLQSYTERGAEPGYTFDTVAEYVEKFAREHDSLT